jgi:Protein of unknown function (DUF1579)
MMNRIAVAGTLTMALWLSTAQAQPPGDNPAKAPGAAPGQAPKPAAENELFKSSSGSWRCEGTAKTPDGQELKYKSTWTVKPALGGHWYALVYKRAKMGPMPPFEGNATLGYNAVEKKYVFVGFDNLGGWVNLSSSDGAVYSGDGAPMGQKGPVKFTFSPGKDKKGQESDKLFDVILDFGAVSSSESCKK